MYVMSTICGRQGALANFNRIAVIILAAGRGARAGDACGPKQYCSIGGMSVLERAIKPFADNAEIGQLAVVYNRDDQALCETALVRFGKGVMMIAGGETRQASTLNGLAALADHPPQFVMIHDAARPFVDDILIQRLIAQMTEFEGLVPAIPISDTLKRGSVDGLVAETVQRGDLFGAQTPQIFPFAAIFQAHQRAELEQESTFTDDASIAEWAGIPVRIVAGSHENFKITWKRDLELAEQMLSQNSRYPDVRTGNGYDVHSFVPGDFVTLCGVKIAHKAKLNGHSDSDVALHALTDALLATCGAGDIGTHFPPSDAQWKGAASEIFVKYAVDMIRSNGGKIANVDVTLICEAPQIGPHRAAMLDAMQSMLGISIGRISVKATTNEKLGFIGRGEGIAAIATASVVFSGELP